MKHHEGRTINHFSLCLDGSIFNNFVIFPGISLGGELPLTKNIWRAEKEQKVKKPPEVVCLQWTDEAEKELLVTLSNHLVKTYSTKLKCFTRLMELEIEEEAKVTNLCCHDAR